MGKDKIFEVVFLDWGFEEASVSNKKFKSIESAKEWARQGEIEYDEIYIDKYGDDQWGIGHKYNNPEDGETYKTFNIRKLK